MAPQIDIPPAANVLGTIGTGKCWCIQLVPQVWHNWKTKDTEGLPSLMLFFWAAAGVPLGVYAIVQNFNIPLQIQPQVFCALALICWAQSFIYSKKWPTLKATLLVCGTGIVFAATEILLIFTLRGPYARGIDWPILLVGILAAVFVAGGLIPAYFELWKRNGRVIGINFLFLTIDWLGAFFSLMAIVAQHTFDVLGGVSYIACMLLEIGITASHLAWLYRTRRVRKEAKMAGLTYDEYVASNEKEVAAKDQVTSNGESPPITSVFNDSTMKPSYDSPC